MALSRAYSSHCRRMLAVQFVGWWIHRGLEGRLYESPHQSAAHSATRHTGLAPPSQSKVRMPCSCRSSCVAVERSMRGPPAKQTILIFFSGLIVLSCSRSFSSPSSPVSIQGSTRGELKTRRLILIFPELVTTMIFCFLSPRVSVRYVCSCWSSMP